MNLPGPGEIYLDHVGWYVPDLDAVAEVFGTMGFPLTPIALHGDKDPKTGEVIPQGSANRLAMLEHGYLEFLTDVEGTDTAVSRHMRDRMGQYIGVHLTAFSVADAGLETARLQTTGISLQPTVNLRRSVEAADGSEAEAGFTVIRAGFDQFPEGRIQTLAHLTPAHVWQDRFIAKDNAIIGLAELVYSVPDPADSAARLATFTGGTPSATDGGMEIILDRGRLRFVAADHFGTAVGLVSADLAQTRRYFLEHNIPLAKESAETLVIDGARALGAELMITQVGGGFGGHQS